MQKNDNTPLTNTNFITIMYIQTLVPWKRGGLRVKIHSKSGLFDGRDKQSECTSHFLFVLR